jgi:hypothetical protein
VLAARQSSVLELDLRSAAFHAKRNTRLAAKAPFARGFKLYKLYERAAGFAGHHQ